MRASLTDATEVAGVVAGSLFCEKADIDSDAGGAQLGVALTRDFRIGILDRSDDAGNAGSDDGVGARRRLAEMRTGLERDVKRRAPRRLTGAPQRFGLCMRAAAGLGPAAPDDRTILHHDRADGWIRPGSTEPAPAEAQRQQHVAAIRFPCGFLGGARFFPELIFQDAEDHLRIVTILAASSSPDSSPSRFSKSLASRKLR
jgi:hypothetical protein